MSRYSQINEFYLSLIAGNQVKVSVSGAEEFNSIRTSLHRYHRLVREIGGSELSLLADLTGQEALFRLGTPRRKRRTLEFEVIADGP